MRIGRTLDNVKDMNSLRKYFFVGVSHVQPRKLMEKILTRNGENLIIAEKKYPLKNSYVVGFGKAVGEMVPVIESVLKTNTGSVLKEGIISVPIGYLKFAESKNIDLSSSSRIKFYEGAKFNLPDEASHSTAEKIVDLVEKLNEDDQLFVLVSGGGSALLPLPTHPVTLDEKIKIVKTLSLRGASIFELNTVRKALSATKGGKLVQNAKCHIISFILSDIINSPLDLIACGPTVPNTDSVEATYEILNKYNIEISSHMKTVLENSKRDSRPTHFDHVCNVLIGDNVTALKSIYESITADKENCIPVIMTSSLQGEASAVGKELARFAFVVLHHLEDQNINLNIESFCENLSFSESTLNSVMNSIKICKKSLCLLFGGETTVTVKGTGKGGRNQEMVLAFSIELEKLSKLYDIGGEINFLSGGTDGIDGPTDAAGAFTYFSSKDGSIRLQTDEAEEQNLDPELFLQDNNSYEYFKKLSGAKYLLQPGHTGTNVMDIQMLLINKIS